MPMHVTPVRIESVAVATAVSVWAQQASFRRSRIESFDGLQSKMDQPLMYASEISVTPNCHNSCKCSLLSLCGPIDLSTGFEIPPCSFMVKASMDFVPHRIASHSMRRCSCDVLS